MSNEYSISDKEFIEKVFYIAFGDNTHNKQYTMEQVLNKIREFSNDSLTYRRMSNTRSVRVVKNPRE
jgi:hypothetical protein